MKSKNNANLPFVQDETERGVPSLTPGSARYPPEAVANLKEATELYLEEFPLEDGRRPIITTFEVAEGAAG